MAKTMIYDAAMTRRIKLNAARKGMKVMSHGAYRAKRKPNSPVVKAKARAVAAAQFGKNADFRRDMYGIVDSE